MFEACSKDEWMKVDHFYRYRVGAWKAWSTENNGILKKISMEQQQAQNGYTFNSNYVFWPFDPF